MGMLMRGVMTVAVCGAMSIAGSAMLSAQASAQQPVKIAFIRSQEVLASAPGRAAADSAFNREVAAFNAAEKNWNDSIATILADYAKAESTMTAPARDARQKTIREKQADFQKRDQEMRAHVQQRQTELIQPIMDQVNKIINDIRAEDNYSMIFDAQAQGGGIVAADRNLDITEQVIARLRTAPPVAAAKSGATPAKPATGPVQAPSGISAHPHSP
jgi:outer membrane protein